MENKITKKQFYFLIALLVVVIGVQCYYIFKPDEPVVIKKELSYAQKLELFKRDYLPSKAEVIGVFPDDERHCLYYLKDGRLMVFDAESEKTEEIRPQDINPEAVVYYDDEAATSGILEACLSPDGNYINMKAITRIEKVVNDDATAAQTATPTEDGKDGNEEKKLPINIKYTTMIYQYNTRTGKVTIGEDLGGGEEITIGGEKAKGKVEEAPDVNGKKEEAAAAPKTETVTLPATSTAAEVKAELANPSASSAESASPAASAAPAPSAAASAKPATPAAKPAAAAPSKPAQKPVVKEEAIE